MGRSGRSSIGMLRISARVRFWATSRATVAGRWATQMQAAAVIAAPRMTMRMRMMALAPCAKSRSAPTDQVIGRRPAEPWRRRDGRHVAHRRFARTIPTPTLR